MSVANEFWQVYHSIMLELRNESLFWQIQSHMQGSGDLNNASYFRSSEKISLEIYPIGCQIRA